MGHRSSAGYGPRLTALQAQIAGMSHQQVQANWTQSNPAQVDYIQNKPTLFSGAYLDLTGKPTLFSGAYVDLTGKPTIPAAQVSADWAAASGVAQILNKPTIPTIAARVFSYPARTLNAAFQVSASRDADVTYSVDIACALSLTGGQTGTLFLEICAASSFASGVQEVARTVNGNTGTLTVGLNITQNSTAQITGKIPTGYYCRLRTDNTVGTPTFTFRSGQEVLL